MEQLIKGKTSMGKWYARPINWAGIWNEKGELVGCNTLFESDSETEVDKYIEAYNAKQCDNPELLGGKNGI